MAFGKQRPASKAKGTFTEDQVADMIAKAIAAAGTKPGKGKVGRPPKREEPEATQVEINDSDQRDGFVNITFTDDSGEPAKPSEDVLKRLKLHGFEWAPSKRQWYGVAQMVPNDLAHHAEFEIPAMPEYDIE